MVYLFRLLGKFVDYLTKINYMRKLLLVLLSLVLIGMTTNNSNPERISRTFVPYPVIDTVFVTLTDTITNTVIVEKEPEIKRVFTDKFRNISDIILFCKYLKTQSSHFHTDVWERDAWAVCQSMLNRLHIYNCTWKQYLATPSINHSSTIRRRVHLTKPFNINVKEDQKLFEMVMLCISGQVPKKFKIPHNIGAFESHPYIPNRAPHYRDSLWSKKGYTTKHKFYYVAYDRKKSKNS